MGAEFNGEVTTPLLHRPGEMDVFHVPNGGDEEREMGMQPRLARVASTSSVRSGSSARAVFGSLKRQIVALVFPVPHPHAVPLIELQTPLGQEQHTAQKPTGLGVVQEVETEELFPKAQSGVEASPPRMLDRLGGEGGPANDSPKSKETPSAGEDIPLLSSTKAADGSSKLDG